MRCADALGNTVFGKDRKLQGLDVESDETKQPRCTPMLRDLGATEQLGISAKVASVDLLRIF